MGVNYLGKMFITLVPGAVFTSIRELSNEPNNLDCSFTAGLSSLDQYLQRSLEPTRVKPLFRYSTLGRAPAWLGLKHLTKPERPGRRKRSSLLCPFVNYEQN